MKCPVCTDIDLTMSERQGVEIDYCPRCRGVWLDRGELDKIMERSDRDDEDRYRGGAREDRPRYDERSHDRDYGHKPYRKKSFWHEIFD